MQNFASKNHFQKVIRVQCVHKKTYKIAAATTTTAMRERERMEKKNENGEMKKWENEYGHLFACICEKNQVCVDSNSNASLASRNTPSRSATDLSFCRHVYIRIHLCFKMANGSLFLYSSSFVFISYCFLFRNAENEREPNSMATQLHGFLIGKTFFFFLFNSNAFWNQILNHDEIAT